MMKITNDDKERNLLKAIRFETPDYIPMFFAINDACWHHYNQEELLDLMEEHKILFPEFVRPKEKISPKYSVVANKDKIYTDDFGCVWETKDNGITGTVVKHPLDNWDKFKSWKCPNPLHSNGLESIDWNKIEKEINDKKSRGGVIDCGLRHGHTFLQLCDIIGYENLMFDMADEEPLLDELISLIENFNLEIVKKYMSIGVDIFRYPEDLGMQVGPMISPELFKKYIKPSYQKIIKPARDAGVAVHMHSDGDIRTLVDDIIDGGVDCINLQDLVNGIDWIADHFSGKTCVDLDIDRQVITPYGTPKQVDDLIKEEVKKIGRKNGGLSMIYGLYPGVPIENVKALMDAMEKYAFYYN